MRIAVWGCGVHAMRAVQRFAVSVWKASRAARAKVMRVVVARGGSAACARSSLSADIRHFSLLTPEKKIRPTL